MQLDPKDQAVLERMWASPIRRIHDGRLQKLCRSCGEWKNLEQLYKDRTKSGRTARCYPCEQVREGLRRARAEAVDEQRLAKTMAELAKEREQKKGAA